MKKLLNFLLSAKFEFNAWVVVLIISVLLWPVSLLTFAQEEPPLVLSLSWLALIFAAYVGLIAAQGRMDK